MPLAIPDYPFKAYLFDCDGTIADSMPLHFVAWSKAFAEWSCTFTEEQFYAWAGRPVDDIIRALNEAQNFDMPVAEVMDRKEAFYREMLHELRGVPEVLEHIERSYKTILFAVVSGSPRDSVEATLHTLGIRDRFQVLVCQGEYANGKPDPEPFLTAAALLNTAPKDCLVFEDADAGIVSAQAAGMQWVKIESPLVRAAR